LRAGPVETEVLIAAGLALSESFQSARSNASEMGDGDRSAVPMFAARARVQLSLRGCRSTCPSSAWWAVRASPSSKMTMGRPRWRDVDCIPFACSKRQPRARIGRSQDGRELSARRRRRVGTGPARARRIVAPHLEFRHLEYRRPMTCSQSSGYRATPVRPVRHLASRSRSRRVGEEPVPARRENERASEVAARKPDRGEIRSLFSGKPNLKALG